MLCGLRSTPSGEPGGEDTIIFANQPRQYAPELYQPIKKLVKVKLEEDSEFATWWTVPLFGDSLARHGMREGIRGTIRVVVLWSD